MSKQLLRKNIYFFIFFTYSFFYPQDNTAYKLDSITEMYFLKADRIGGFTANLQALKTFKKIGNIEGTVAAYINLSEQFSLLGRHKESITYLYYAENNMKTIKNPFLYLKLHAWYGKNYSQLGLYSKANKSYNKALWYSKKIRNVKLKKKYMFFIHSNKWDDFEQVGQLDSSFVERKKCLAISPRSAYTYCMIADNYMNIRKNRQYDSAKYYLNKADSYVTVDASPFVKSEILRLKGDFYKGKGKYEKANKYYFQALYVSIKLDDINAVKDIYKGIYSSYKCLNDYKKAEEYYKRYSNLNVSISKNKDLVFKAIIEKLEKEKEKEIIHKNLFFLLVIIAFFFSIFLCYYLYKAYQKKQEKNKLIEKQSILIKEQYLQSSQLKKRICLSIDNLAKSGDPFFLKHFKETYPDFCDKLEQINHNLTQHDLKICAYIKLSLSVKEIAQLENITIQSVETKKYRLKKKLNIEPKVNFIEWVLNLGSVDEK